MIAELPVEMIDSLTQAWNAGDKVSAAKLLGQIREYYGLWENIRGLAVDNVHAFYAQAKKEWKKLKKSELRRRDWIIQNVNKRILMPTWDTLAVGDWRDHVSPMTKDSECLINYLRHHCKVAAAVLQYRW